jgi:hypothetical protein
VKGREASRAFHAGPDASCPPQSCDARRVYASMDARRACAYAALTKASAATRINAACPRAQSWLSHLCSQTPDHQQLASLTMFLVDRPSYLYSHPAPSHLEYYGHQNHPARGRLSYSDPTLAFGHGVDEWLPPHAREPVYHGRAMNVCSNSCNVLTHELTDVHSGALPASRITTLRIHGRLPAPTSSTDIRCPSPLVSDTLRRRLRHGAPEPNAQSITPVCFALRRNLKPTLRVVRPFVAVTRTTRSLSPVWYVSLC